MRATQALGSLVVFVTAMYVFMIVYDFELRIFLLHLLRDIPTSPRTSIHPELRRMNAVSAFPHLGFGRRP